MSGQNLYKKFLDRSETGSLGGLVRFFSNWHDNSTGSILSTFIMKKLNSLGFVKTLYVFISENVVQPDDRSGKSKPDMSTTTKCQWIPTQLSHTGNGTDFFSPSN